MLRTTTPRPTALPPYRPTFPPCPDPAARHTCTSSAVRRWPIPLPFAMPSRSFAVTVPSRPSWSSPRWRGLPMRSWKWRNRQGAASRAPSRRLDRPAPRPPRRGRAVAAARRPAPGRRAALHQRSLRRAGGAGAGTAAAPRADPAHHRLPGLPRRASERAARRRRARGGRHPRPVRGRDRPGAHRRRVRPGGARTTPAPTAPSSGSSRRCSAAASCRSCRASSAPRPRARSPPWAAAAPISPPRSSPGASARRGSRSGRTCPASSPPIHAWSRTRGSFPSSTPARRRSSPTMAPRCSTRARSSRSTGRRIPVFVRPFADPDSAGTEVSERVGARAESGEGADSRRRAGARHRHRQRHAGRAGHRRAHLRRPSRRGGSPSHSSPRRRRSTRSASACPEPFADDARVGAGARVPRRDRAAERSTASR